MNGKDLFGCEEEIIQKKENIYVDDAQFSLASFNHNDFMKDDLSIFDKSQNNNYELKENSMYNNT